MAKRPLGNADDPQFFVELVTNPQRWQKSAHELFLAARCLERQIVEWTTPSPLESMTGAMAAEASEEHHAVYRLQLLAIALAIENGFKSVLAARRKLWVENGHLKGLPKGDPHDLVRLVEMTGCPFCSEQEKKWLSALTSMVRWISRYPGPLSESELTTCQSADAIPHEHPNLFEFAAFVLQWTSDEASKPPRP